LRTHVFAKAIKQPVLTLCGAALLLVAANAQAISVNAQAGKHFTTLGVGMGTSTPGLAVSGSWTRSDHDGSLADAGLSYNIPIGPVTATVGGKGLYMHPQVGKSGEALAVGGGLQWPVTTSLTLYGEGYVAPRDLTWGVKAYQEASGGVRWSVVRPLTVDVGYRYMSIEGKSGKRDNAIADGPYIGAALNF